MRSADERIAGVVTPHRDGTEADVGLPDPRHSFWGRHERLLQALVVVTLFAGAAYLTWRVAVTGRGAFAPTYAALLAAEVFGYLSLAAYAAMAWHLPGPSRRPDRRRRPSVDVFVCTYDEPVAVVHATLAGCRAIRHPHTTWLLDDGRRPEMAALAEAMGARYLTRPDNRHAKAGNINHALAHTAGELILVLDADHVPLPEILDATVGYFDDPGVALVQTPHEFYNRDSVQHTTPFRHEQSLFYRVVAPGKDRWNSMFWCGSATVLRRRALEAVGGVLTDTVAEDFHTSIALHAAGWRSRYHDEPLVRGLAPHDVDAFLLQRDRWARGNLRVLRTPQSPLRTRDLTLRQRVSYLASLLAYGVGPQKLVMFVVLVVTLVSGRLPLTATPATLLGIWAPYTALAYLTTIALARGTLGPADSTRHHLMTMGIYTRAFLVLVSGGARGFRVTPKEGVDRGGLHVLRSMPLLTATGVVLAVSVALRAADAAGLVGLPPMPRFALILTLALGAWELAWITRILGRLARRRQLRRRYRFPVELRGVVDGEVVRIVDLSPAGLAMETGRAPAPGRSVRVRIALPAVDGQVHEVHLPAAPRTMQRRPDGTWRIGAEFGDLDTVTRDRLVEYCHIVVPSRELRPRPGAAVIEPAAADPAAAAGA